MRISVCQFAAGRDVSANREQIAALAAAAATDGARLAVFPETAMYYCVSSPDQIRQAAQPLDGPFVTELTGIAQETGLVLVVGMYEANGIDRPNNTVVVVGREGLLAHHRKFLVYDAFGFRESDLVEAAEPRADLFEIGGFTIGLITCYEIRFPDCARSLVDAGADLLLVSSAWPIGQGKEDHFVTMVRSRALENTVYVAASGDCNPTMAGRSQVVDPLGYQLAGLADEVGHAVVDLDHDRITRARQVLPVLEQRRRHLACAAPTVHRHSPQRPSLEA